MNASAILKKLPRFTAYPYHYIGAAVLALTLFYLLFVAVDTRGLDLKYAVTRVANRHYRPLSHTTVTSTSGNSVRTHSRAVPPAWMIAVTIDGVSGWGQVTSGEYDKMKEGVEVEVVYGRKRISRDLAIRTIRIMKPLD